MDWRKLFKKNVINAAEDYLKGGYIRNFKFEDTHLTAIVTGLDTYRVNIEISDDEIQAMECDCPHAERGGRCRHMAAVLLAMEESISVSEDNCVTESDICAVEQIEEQENSSQDSEAMRSASYNLEESAIIRDSQNRVEFSSDIDDVLTYAVVHNGAHIVRDIMLKNLTEEDICNITLGISSTNELLMPFEYGIAVIKSGEEIHLKDLNIIVNANYLANLTERINCQITIIISFGDTTICETKNIVALAFDEWPGLQYTPELLSTFAMPNHPATTGLLQIAAKYLEKWTGDPSLAGYQFNDINRVKLMAAAAYAAIQQKNIIYAEPPSSFETVGQRIRLADTVLEQHMGTCMDMTLMYVACLEAMGLNPVLVLIRGHIFSGVWLVEDSFPDMIMDDPSQLEKRMSKGIHEMIVVECTAMCSGKTKSFDEAIAMAEYHVANYRDFAFAIDIKRARSMGIRPLPVRLKKDSGYEVQHEERNENNVTSAPSIVGDTFDLSYSADQEKTTKQTQWERKLLDLSLRNMLINMRMTKAVVPLLSANIGVLEDALADGEEFYVRPRPSEISIKGDGGVPVEALGDLGPLADYIALESKHKRLHSLYTEGELSSCLTKMYRSAKTSLEENGASTLYLALGLLRWFEGKKDAVARYAPIVLVPIDINRKSANKGYAMRMRDEDAQINITLLEFLKQNYNLPIYGLNPPPVDDHGLDIPKIFAIIRHAVMNLPMWDVVEVGFIGNFSFSQFVMWNDIHNNSDYLRNNKIVNSLITGSVDWDSSIPKDVDSDEAYLPVTVDSSQLRAINMASGGVSFVLHGPPGTGKSQTITAMIANALTKGKSILFVAEKMAALEVVQRRLTTLGIEDFCLELHSNKATKKAVLDQLRKGLELGTWGMQTDYDKKIQDIRKMRSDLDAYVKALHTKRPFGKSLRQLMDIYETIPEQMHEIRFDHDYVSRLSESDLNHQIQSLQRLITAGKEIGHPHNHPLSMVYKKEYSQKLKFELETVVDEYRKSLVECRNATESFSAYVCIAMPVSKKEWNDVCDFAKCIIALDEIPDFLRRTDSVNKEFSVPMAFIDKKEQFLQKKEKFLSQWNENFLRMNMETFRNRFEQANKKFFGKGKALASLTAELQAYASFAIETDRIPVYLTDVAFFQKESDAMQADENNLSYEWRSILERYPRKYELNLYQNSILMQLEFMKKYSDQIHQLESEGKLEQCIPLAMSVLKAKEMFNEKETEITNLLDLRFTDSDQNWFDERLELCNCILDNASSLKDWIIFRQFESECSDLGLQNVCTAYESGMEHEELIDTYLKSIYRTIILSVIEKEPVLNGFSGSGFNERVAQFKKMDQEFMDLTKEEMYYKLSHNLPTTDESIQISKELNILRRAISSNGRGMSIRSLFEQIPTILTRLCPCMLMSPISVAQYLAPENNLFDIVIFDEASQLPTCKAIGVLARGKNAVIVGDPNQMPPTSFFAGNKVDEDNLDLEDLDSILDDCLALGMPQSHLHWHYRSRHESLIAFSNREFYENSMLTFPSVNDREKKVKLVKTEGYFDRGKGRVNEGEAKAIVHEIKRRYKDEYLTNQTIGVVTFNISQQALIEDLLQEEYLKDSEFDKWANFGEERLFVKNLENVQGDERDTILFSVAFGPDSEGRLSLNFGPLNKNGGWKRLNVAVSRARYEMVVFTTMTADMIDLRRTKSKGVESLKNFLEFAEKGKLQGEYTDARMQKKQGILERICKTIDDAGMKYQTAVGHSKFKIDIAVLNPYKEDEYLLGIMLDGDSYCQSANTKDREVAQIDVLNGLGWTLHRIWSLDWWDNRDKELSKLAQILEQKKEEAYQKYQEKSNELSEQNGEISGGLIDNIIETLDTDPEVLNEVATEVKEIDEYAEPSDDTNGEDNNAITICSDITEKAELALDQTICEKVMSAVGKENDNSKVIIDKAAIEDSSENAETVCVNRTYQVILYESADIQVEPMSVNEYVLKESSSRILNVMQAILDTESPITHDRLVKKTLRTLGIGRSSTQTIEATEKAMKKLVAKSNKQAGVKYYWKKDVDFDTYSLYRIDSGSADKRSADEICQQELKNAICITLMEKGPLEKEVLIKETIRTMGYSRTGAALVTAVERGLKYGRKTGEISLNSDKLFEVQMIMKE